jgi:hypothetical protein
MQPLASPPGDDRTCAQLLFRGSQSAIPALVSGFAQIRRWQFPKKPRFCRILTGRAAVDPATLRPNLKKMFLHG